MSEAERATGRMPWKGAKAMKSEAIRKICEEKQIRMIDFKMTDIDGRWRHITIPVERFEESVFTYGIGFDGSNYGYAPIEKSDMVFLPDADTAYVDPFASVPTLTMCGNVCTIGKGENKPFDQYPKNVSLRAVEYMKESGVADRMNSTCLTARVLKYRRSSAVTGLIQSRQTGIAAWIRRGIMDMRFTAREVTMWRLPRMWDMICAAGCA